MTATARGRTAAPASPDRFGGRDPRLRAWRDVLTGAIATALGTYRSAWSGPDLTDAARAVAGVGALDTAGPHRHVHRALPTEGLLAEVADAAGLDPGREAVLAAAWWTANDPQLAVAFGCVHDDARRRYASLAALRLVLAPLGVQVPVTVSPDDALVRCGLLQSTPGPDRPLLLAADGAELLARTRQEPPLARPMPPRLARVAAHVCLLIESGGRVAVRCEAADDPVTLRDAVAGRLGLVVPAVPRAAGIAGMLLRLGFELPAVVVDAGGTTPEGTVLALGATDLPVPAGWHAVDVPAPAVTAAERLWRAGLRRAGVRATRADVSGLAGRLALGEAAVDAVVDRASAAAAARGERPTVRDVGAALRHQPRHDPAGLARRLPAALTLDELALTPATRTALEEVVAHGRWSTVAHEALGLAGTRGRAVVALFHGPSGTGKTAAAEAVASALDRDLWVVDLAQVVSKWLGETQRHLDTLLSDAAAAGVVLLFDEADGLFGKRGEVTDARDRYANLEIDHLLQRIELHTGVVVLTSNRPAALDDAFLRRLRLSVRFDPPDHALREELWRRFLPQRLLADGADTSAVAREELPGASIRAAALDATVRALAEGSPVTAQHLAAAVRRELEKTRRPLTARAASS